MKRILLGALLLMSVSGVFAQKFQLGIKAGTNISNFITSSSQYNTSYSALVGWNAGAFINFMVGDHFAISPEILYSTAGARIKATSSDNGTTVTKNDLKLEYLSIPVFAKYRFTGGFYIETGPEANINISSSRFEDQSVKSITKSAEFAWGAGLGYHSPIGLGIGARYNIGISKVNDNSNVSFNNSDFRNSGFMIDLFWTLFNNHR